MTDKKKRKPRRYKNKQNSTRRNSAAEQSFRTKETESLFSEDSGTEFHGRKEPAIAEKKEKQAGEKSRRAKRKTADKAEHSYQRVFGRGGGKSRVAVTGKGKNFEENHLAGFTGMAYKDFSYGLSSEENDDNPAAEALREGQQKMADGYRFIGRYKRKRNQRHHKKEETAKRKRLQKEAGFQYRKFLKEHPEMQEKALKKQVQKRLQKQRIKREYAKAVRAGRTAKNTKEAARKSANTATSAAKKLQEMIGKRASVIISAGMAGILLLMVMTSVSSCGAVFQAA